MSGSDYTKKAGISKGFSWGIAGFGVRERLYRLIFMARTRWEKWLSIVSFVLSVAGCVAIVWVGNRVEQPADIVISCPDLAQNRVVEAGKGVDLRD